MNTSSDGFAGELDLFLKIVGFYYEFRREAGLYFQRVVSPGGEVSLLSLPAASQSHWTESLADSILEVIEETFGQNLSFPPGNGRPPEESRRLQQHSDPIKSALALHAILSQDERAAAFARLKREWLTGSPEGRHALDELPLPYFLENPFEVLLRACWRLLDSARAQTATGQLATCAPGGPAGATHPTDVAARAQPGDQPASIDPAALPPLQIEIIKHLLSKGADTESKRLQLSDIASAIGPGCSSNTCGKASAALRRAGLTESKPSGGGGVWLTVTGKRMAEHLRAV